MRVFDLQMRNTDPPDDGETPDSFIGELNTQCNRLVIPGSLIAAVAWLFYIPIDRQLHPDEPLIIAIRMGFCVLAALILIAQLIPQLQGRGMLSLIILGSSLEISTAVLTGLSGGDPVYIGGFLFVLMLIPMVPIPRVVQWGLTSVSLACFFVSGSFHDMRFDSLSASYSLLDIIAVTVISVVFTHVLHRIRYHSWRKSKRIEIQNIEAIQGRLNIDSLLSHMLPASVADELKVRGFTRPSYHKAATIVFMEFSELGRNIESMNPEGLVGKLNRYLSHFDSIIERYGLERLRAFSDSYMYAGGVPEASPTHALDAVLAALEILSFTRAQRELDAGGQPGMWSIRIGISSGMVLAGIAGEKKFVYDVWGDPVYLAHGMMLAAGSGSIRISSATNALVGGFFEVQGRSEVQVRHAGLVDSHALTGIRKEFSEGGAGLTPNEALMARREEMKNRA